MSTAEILNIIVANISIIISISAIFISIGSTKRQTKMDLFDKRYNVYFSYLIICRTCSIREPEMAAKRLAKLDKLQTMN